MQCTPAMTSPTRIGFIQSHFFGLKQKVTYKVPEQNRDECIHIVSVGDPCCRLFSRTSGADVDD